MTGPFNQKHEYLVAGCHSGNILVINNNTIKPGSTLQHIKKELITNGHLNLIRVVISLETLNHRFFASADVCGIIKVWSSLFKPQAMLEFDLEQAMSYNSMIELNDVLPEPHF